MVDQLPRGLEEDASKKILGAAREGKWEAVDRRLGSVDDVQALINYRAFVALNYKDQLKDSLGRFLVAIDTRLAAMGVISKIEKPVTPSVVPEVKAKPIVVDLPPKRTEAPARQVPSGRGISTPNFAPATPSRDRPAQQSDPISRGPAPSAAPRQPVAPVQQRPATLPARPEPTPTRAPAVAAAPVARGPAPTARPRVEVNPAPVRSSREGR